MVIKGVNFWSFLFASQMGGYAMMILDEVYAKWFGLFGLFPGIKDPAWFIHHQIDSTLFAIPLVLPFVWNKVPSPGLVKGILSLPIYGYYRYTRSSPYLKLCYGFVYKV